VLGIALELYEREWGRVVEALTGGPVQEDRAHRAVDVLRQRRGLFPHGILGRLKNAVQATKYREGEDDSPVFRCLVVAAQEVGDRPDEGDLLRMPVHLSPNVLRLANP
jgi:hypothetical protein